MLTCVANCVFSVPPSPKIATLQLSMEVNAQLLSGMRKDVHKRPARCLVSDKMLSVEKGEKLGSEQAAFFLIQ